MTNCPYCGGKFVKVEEWNPNTCELVEIIEHMTAWEGAVCPGPTFADLPAVKGVIPGVW